MSKKQSKKTDLRNQKGSGEVPRHFGTGNEIPPMPPVKPPKPDQPAGAKSGKRCKVCDFFDQFLVPDSDADGKCRRHAPSVFINNIPYPAPANFQTIFPTVTVDDWCGDGEFSNIPE